MKVKDHEGDDALARAIALRSCAAGPPERLTNFDTSDPVPLRSARGAFFRVSRSALRRTAGTARARIDRARAAVRAAHRRERCREPRRCSGHGPGRERSHAATMPHFVQRPLASLAVSACNLVLVVLGLTRALRALLTA